MCNWLQRLSPWLASLLVVGHPAGRQYLWVEVLLLRIQHFHMIPVGCIILSSKQECDAWTHVRNGITESWMIEDNNVAQTLPVYVSWLPILHRETGDWKKRIRLIHIVQSCSETVSVSQSVRCQCVTVTLLSLYSIKVSQLQYVSHSVACQFVIDWKCTSLSGNQSENNLCVCVNLQSPATVDVSFRLYVMHSLTFTSH